MRLFYTVYEGKNSAKRQKFVHITTQSSQTEAQVNTSSEHAQVVSSTTMTTGEQKQCATEKSVDNSVLEPNKDKHRHKNGLQSPTVNGGNNGAINGGLGHKCQHKDKKSAESTCLSNDIKYGHTKNNKMTNGSPFTHMTPKRPEHSILVKDKLQKFSGLNGFSKASVHFRD